MTHPVDPPERPDATDDDDALDTPTYPRLAPVMVALAVVLFVLMVTLLGYRWLTTAEPNGFVEVQGTSAYAGVRVEIASSAMDSASSARLSSDNNYTAHFPLPPGTYRVSILDEDHLLQTRNLTLREGNGYVFTLDPKLAPASRPTTTHPSILQPVEPLF